MRGKRKEKKRRSLLFGMVCMLLFGWFLPLLLMNGAMSILATGKINKQIQASVLASTDKAAQILQLRLQECEKASKNASYLNVVRSAYEQYQKDGKKREFQTKIFTFMDQQYRFDECCRSASLVFRMQPDEIYYTYNNSTGGTYRDIAYFQQNVSGRLVSEMDELDTKTELRNFDGRLYLVRNLVDAKFRPFAILALELDQKAFLESMESIWGYQQAAVYVDGTLCLYTAKEAEMLPYGEAEREQLDKAGILFRQGKNGQSSCVYKRLSAYHATLDYIIALDDSAIYAETVTIRYLFALLAAFIIPLVYLIYQFLHKRVNKPVKELIRVFDVVRTGEYGAQLQDMADSEEFYHMEESFNYMSAQLKEQFDRIYREEIALRDARIMALQSQINPHFLNNTLEIINWEARLNGNLRVSQMIESLSTMLEATMNRKADPYNTVAEEMVYVDAYLYIISQRYGEKFVCRKEIDESLLGCKIPRLIVQPIAENAVEHGMSAARAGELIIRLYKKRADLLCIEIENDRPLKSEDEEKIRKLLQEAPDPQKERRVSLGIRNVDQRLKMMYGEECGLFISNNKKSHTVSTILVKIDETIEQ